MKKRETVFYLWLLMVVFAITAGICLLAVSALPYPTLKAFGDALSKDGSLESLTPQRYARFHLPVLALSCGLLAAGGVMLWRRARSRSVLARLLAIFRLACQRVGEGFRDLFADLKSARLEWSELLILALIMAFAAFLRLALIHSPMDYDEAYTFTEFARHSFGQIISDYHVPNNHVFHTILVHFAYLLLGNSPWVIRIPAFLAGMALIPAVFYLARRTYPPYIRWVAAGGVAVFPVLVIYSVSARGYSLICLWTVCLLLLSDYVRLKRNPAGWVLMVIVTALGFYTIPIMLYPFGIALTWLLLSGIFSDISPQYHGLGRWLAYLAGYCACAGLLTIFLYTPIFHSNGILTVFAGNTVVNPLSIPVFLSRLPFEFTSAVEGLQAGNVPAWVLPLLLAGSILSVFYPRNITRQRVPVQAAAFLFLALVFIFQRPQILARVWLFLLTLLILWGTAGLLGLVNLVRFAAPRADSAERSSANLAELAPSSGAANGTGTVTPRANSAERSSANASSGAANGTGTVTPRRSGAANGTGTVTPRRSGAANGTGTVTPRLNRVQNGIAVLILAVLFFGGFRFAAPYLANPDPGYNDSEIVTRYFQTVLKDGDVVVVSNDDDAIYWYYFDYYHISEKTIRGIKSRPFQHAYIISHPNPHWTIESIIRQFGPDLGFFRMDTLKPVTQIRNTIIYEIWPDQGAVDRAFGVHTK